MKTSLVGKFVRVVRFQEEQKEVAGLLGRVEAVSQNGWYFRVLVRFPGRQLWTFDGNDLVAYSHLQILGGCLYEAAAWSWGKLSGLAQRLRKKVGK
jgi:hypothetical protein